MGQKAGGGKSALFGKPEAGNGSSGGSTLFADPEETSSDATESSTGGTSPLGKPGAVGGSATPLANRGTSSGGTTPRANPGAGGSISPLAGSQADNGSSDGSTLFADPGETSSDATGSSTGGTSPLGKPGAIGESATPLANPGVDGGSTALPDPEKGDSATPFNNPEGDNDGFTGAAADSAAEESAVLPGPEADEDSTAGESTVFSDPGSSLSRKRGKPPRLTLIIAAAAVALVAVVTVFALRLGRSGGTGESSSAANTLYAVNHSAGDLSSVTVTTEGDTYTLLPKTDEGSEDPAWVLQGYEDIPTAGAKDVAAAAAALPVVREMTGAPEDYGLTAPYATVKVTLAAGGEYTISVGDESPDATGRYVRVDGGAVYLAELDAYADMLVPPTELVDSTVYPDAGDTTDSDYFADGELTFFDSLTITGSGRSRATAVSCDKGATLPYYLTQPVRQIADSEKVSSLLGLLTTGVPNAGAYVLHPTAADLHEYGLDTPYSELSLTYAGRTVKFTLGAERDGFYPLTVTGVAAIYKVDASAVPWADYTERDLRSIYLFMEDIKGVDRLTVEGGGESFVFDIAHDGDDYTVTCGGKTFTSKRFAPLYRKILGLRGEEFSDEARSDLSAADIRVTVRYTDGSRAPDVLRFTRDSERRYFYSVNGRGNAFVSAANAEAILSAARDLLAGREIAE